MWCVLSSVPARRESEEHQTMKIQFRFFIYTTRTRKTLEFKSLTSPSTVKMESAFWGSKCFIRRLLRWFSTRSWTWAGSTPAVKTKKLQISKAVRWWGKQKEVHRQGDTKYRTQGRTRCGPLHTHLDEPLCQQVNGLSHSRVIIRKTLNDKFWRTACKEIPARAMGFLLSNVLLVLLYWLYSFCLTMTFVLV